MRPPGNHPQLPTHDYSLALQHAVSWLGDRYLLAVPLDLGSRVRRGGRLAPHWFRADQLAPQHANPPRLGLQLIVGNAGQRGVP